MAKRSPDLRRFYKDVARGAWHRCEYCHAPETLYPNRFTIDHVIPRSRGGSTTLGNLALCCSACQQQKLDFETGWDPVGKVLVRLFSPRRHRWSRHFRWSHDSLWLEGLTPIGRATVERLSLNSPRHIAARSRWVQHPDLFP